MTNDYTHLDLHGDKVAYRDVGRGDTILLIHGMAGSSATWDAVLPKLAAHHRVIAPDLPGHGESDKPRGDYSLGAFAAFLRDLLDELRVEQVTVVSRWVVASQCNSRISIPTIVRAWCSSVAGDWDLTSVGCCGYWRRPAPNSCCR